ncbi:MAG: 4-hydroxy-tetrahydrodipicolinate reductase [Rhodospirillales bacterium]|nr:4-hydroxy-tetrahydrodipicolinate reductase [Rhodospirillales bacterium]
MKIGVVGCTGRMGRMVVAEITGTGGCELAGGTESAGHPKLGEDVSTVAGLAASGLKVSDDPAALFSASDAVIDFTVPEATLHHAGLAADSSTALVAGTTGMGDEQVSALGRAAARAPIVLAPNFSAGVNLLLGLTEQVAGVLGEDFDIEIVEMHHKHKVDAPSGTALGLGEAAAKGRGVGLNQVADRGRDGITGERQPGRIGFAALRGGDVVGEHTVVFAGAGERIELTHKAASRVIFARGAVRAALWTEGRPAGLYSMMDVLGFGS